MADQKSYVEHRNELGHTYFVSFLIQIKLLLTLTCPVQDLEVFITPPPPLPVFHIKPYISLGVILKVHFEARGNFPQSSTL